MPVTGRPSGCVAGLVFTHEPSPGSSPGFRFRKISTSVTTSVPAARWCVPAGSRKAPMRSACAYIFRRASTSEPSIVNWLVMTASTPPGFSASSAFRMKWLWIECFKPLLCFGSRTA